MKEKLMKDTEEPTIIWKSREMQDITVTVPKRALKQLGDVAKTKDTTVDALLRFYIGQGLRQDLMYLFSNRLMNTTEEVLSRHNLSEEERSAIIQEIKQEVAA